jgi:outer membrane protein
MLTPNWGFDILGALPFSHDIEANGAKVAETKHLPPTFSFQYHFLPDGNFMPYVGAGVNYTVFFDESVEESVFPGGDLSIDDSFGLALQIGADIKINDSWIFQIDVRYVDIEPDVSLDTGAGILEFDAGINPMVYSLSIGRIF